MHSVHVRFRLQWIRRYRELNIWFLVNSEMEGWPRNAFCDRPACRRRRPPLINDMGGGVQKDAYHRA